MKNRMLMTALTMLLTIGISIAQSVPSGTLRVGVAKEVMNPPASILTSSSDVSRRFAGVHDSLFVRTIVMDNGVNRAALVSLDISKAPGGAKFIEEIAAAVDIRAEYLYIAATHNHNTIQVPASDNTSEHYKVIRDAAIKSIKAASARLQPAKIGYGTGKAYINSNRDEKMGEGYHMGYNPEGISDKTVSVVTFTSTSGEPIAIYANYPVHAVVMYRAATKNGLPEITGDLPGFTARYLEKHFPNTTAVWTSGAAGDQNPIFMATYNQDHPDVVDQGLGGYSILDVQSRRLGEEIVRIVKATKNTESEVKIWGRKTFVTCPGQKRKNPPAQGEVRGGYLAPSKIEMIDGDPVTIPLHLLMINDIALAGVGAEVFTGIGLNLKAQSRFDRTVMVTVMANSIGYIPTDAAYKLPSEKAISNSLRPGCAEPAMIQAFIQMMDEYKSATQAKSIK